MCRFPSAISGLFVLALTGFNAAAADTPKQAAYYGYGEQATAEQISGWDIDVRPDGKGLPPGSGSVEDGEYLYEEQCAECHGSFGEGEGQFPVLAGGEGSLQDARPQKTVGSFWNYTSTLWDYIHRAMPFTQPESLSDDEVYAVTAYVLYLNELVEDDFVLTQQNLAEIKLPNEANFVPDPRPDVHNTRCMKNCRDPKKITIMSEAPQYIPDPTILEETPQTSAGSVVYLQSCALCHDRGLGGAPTIGNAAQWSGRVSQGTEVLYNHAINGYQGELGMMPAKGGFVQLSDDEVKAAVDYIMELSQ
ncbi:MAG: c-type cytochrome [Halioglobus sp.]